jgi:CheY-like chemotaxis protein
MTDSPDTHEIAGLRVLVVEDTLLVAEVIIDELTELGCSIVGPASRLQQGLALALREQFDGALLDVNLAGERCFPIADALTERGIPFAFLTGYGDAGIPSQYRAAPRLSKPFYPDDLERMIARSFKRIV